MAIFISSIGEQDKRKTQLCIRIQIHQIALLFMQEEIVDETDVYVDVHKRYVVKSYRNIR